MKQSTTVYGLSKDSWFQLFKYSVYVLITLNTIQFFREDLLASGYTFRGGVSWAQLTDAYATTIDSAAWLALLLMFELETYVIPDEKMGAKTRWTINIVAAVCFVFILKAFLGYFEKYSVISAYAVVGFDTACSAVGAVQSYVVEFDEYMDLTAANCAVVVGKEWYVHEGSSILASTEMLAHMKAMALTDVINAGTWIVIVIVLQIDVLLQMRRSLTKKLYRSTIFIKAALYLVLFAAAVYWGYLSALLDFWDAMLWIIAFFFIELNLFQWNEETRERCPAAEGDLV